MPRANRHRLFEHRNGPVAWVGGLAAVLIIGLLLRQALITIGGVSAWQQAELDTAVNRFHHMALLANAEWHRQGRGEQVQLLLGEPGTEQTVTLRMSQRGWPQPAGATSMNDSQCLSLWHELLGDIRPKVAVTAEWQGMNSDNEVRGACVFYANDKVQFSYSVHNGQLIRGA